AKKAAEEHLKNAKSSVDIATAQTELAIFAAQLTALRKFRKQK
ncbi:MAG: F0F1 ATP synthase subunit epsilon, partial [Betaproteobacteria bacterium]|nr:F0F1 ATP synthase subunit epsilon [Betaproteobacteria bacterium]